MIIPLIGAGVKSKSAIVNAQRRINCYLEPQRDQDKTALAVYGTPGLTKVLDQGALVYRGGVTVGDLLYLAQGNVFKECNNAFVTTDRNAAARLTTNAGRVNMATNETTIVVIDGANGYIYDTSALTFAQIGSAMFASPQTVTYQDGFYLATFIETGTNKKRCQISADGVTWNALDFRGIDTTPGALIRTLSFEGEVHQFADKGIEFWAYTGDPTFPFQPIRGATIPVGLAARWSIAIGQSSIYFLGRDRSATGVQVYELQGHTVRSISTPDLSDAISKYATASDATAYFIGVDEHDFYILSFPTAGKTWMYDAFASNIMGMPVWSELQSGNGGRHYSDLGFSLVNKGYVSDYATGKLYLIDPNSYTDNGMAIDFEIDTRHFFKDYEYVTVDQLVADFETGVGIAGNADPFYAINYMNLSGVPGTYASTQNSVALTFPGNVSLAAYAALVDWTPAADSALIAKSLNIGNNRQIQFLVNNTTGKLSLTTFVDGIAGVLALSTVAPAVVDGAGLWVRADRVMDNGAGGNTTKFYTATDAPTTALAAVAWTQLGAPVVNAGTTSLFAGTADLSIGGFNAGGVTDALNGKIYRGVVYNGAFGGAVAADFNANDGAAGGAVPFASHTTGEIYTLNGAAKLVAEAVAQGANSYLTPATVGANPQVMLQVSRDGGRTWGAEMWFPLGKIGEYMTTIRSDPLGTARDFVFKFRISDPVKRVLTGIGLRATPAGV